MKIDPIEKKVSWGQTKSDKSRTFWFFRYPPLLKYEIKYRLFFLVTKSPFLIDFDKGSD